MAIKKLMSFGRYVLIVALVLYLLLAWLYFKDNTAELTTRRLTLWFVAIPVLFIIFIVMLKITQKKLTALPITTAAPTQEDHLPALPESQTLYLHSSLCLPEGQSWTEVINNTDDLTVLSEDLVDEDNLPVLIKPISSLTDPAEDLERVLQNLTSESLASRSEDLSISRFEDQEAIEISAVTKRVCQLIDELLIACDQTINAFAEHFAKAVQSREHTPNSAISIHPDWQQNYIVSAKGDPDYEPVLTDQTLTQLPMTLCLPQSADQDLLSSYIRSRLAEYAIDEVAISFISPPSGEETPDHPNDQNLDKNKRDLGDLISAALVSIAEPTEPQVLLFIAADSQINEDWLESQSFQGYSVSANRHSSNQGSISSALPMEAGLLIMAWNEPMQTLLSSETTLPPKYNYSVTRFEGSPPEQPRLRYAGLLKNIQRLILQRSLASLTPATEEKSKENKPTTKYGQHNSTINPKIEPTNLLENVSIHLLSDINLLSQPYDLSEIIKLSTELENKGALVNNHNLGHYMPLNPWMKSLVSLALFLDLSEIIEQPSNIIFLITQHNSCCLLWQAHTIKTS